VPALFTQRLADARHNPLRAALQVDPVDLHLPPACFGNPLVPVGIQCLLFRRQVMGAVGRARESVRRIFCPTEVG
jgi:hypothetical protein